MWEGEKGGAFCSVYIFHNQKMHVYLIFYCNMLAFYVVPSSGKGKCPNEFVN